jgi:hypothetical protein
LHLGGILQNRSDENQSSGSHSQTKAVQAIWTSWQNGTQLEAGTRSTAVAALISVGYFRIKF